MGDERELIQVRIAPDGTVTAETMGMTGPKCLDYVDVLEDLLQATAVQSAFTSDYYTTTTQEQTEASNDLQQHS